MPFKNIKTQFAVRTTGSVVLLVLEIIFLTVSFDTFQRVDHPVYKVFSYSGIVIRLLISMIGATLVLSFPRRALILSSIKDYFENAGYLKWLIVHLLLITAFYYLTWLLFEHNLKNFSLDDTVLYFYGLAWLFVGLASVISLLFVSANRIFWVTLLKVEYRNLLLAMLAALLMQFIGSYFTEAWKPMAKLTFSLSSQILAIFFTPIFSDPDLQYLGTEHFKVQISPACSGYEGMGLICVFLGLYIWIFRRQLRFPQVLLLFPIGIMSMWLLNVLRIVALISLGDMISPEIAVGGFHSSAGWIAFVTLSIILVFLCQKLTFFNVAQPGTDRLPTEPISTATALLAPFVILLASILILSAFTASFDWLYPLKVLVAGITLWRFRQCYKAFISDFSYSALLIGAIVFVLWLMLVASSPNLDQKFADTLFSQSSFLVCAWIFFRILGTSLTVPIIEELAFRGYLLAKLVDMNYERVPQGKFTWLSFVVSSVLFGILHNEWLAGTLAGMLYAYAFYRRKMLFDAVLAHITTNLLLSIYILITGHWSLW